MDLPGLNWSIIAKIDTSEAFAPVSAFTRTLVLSTAVDHFRGLSRRDAAGPPVRPADPTGWRRALSRSAPGDYDITLPVQSRDEFGDLTVAFNDMSRNLAIKEELLTEQRRENDRLMLSLMPEPVVQRYREGEETISQDHQDVTVIFADIVGLDELSADLNSDELLAIVNKLTRQFDAAAENLGVEQVRTLHNGYLASCGLSVPRLDNVRRTVDFAIEMQRVIDRFNAETGHHLELRAGIDTGTVTSGLVGRSRPRLRHVGLCGQSRVSGAERFAAARGVCHVGGLRRHARHTVTSPQRASSPWTARSSRSGGWRIGQS